MRMRVDLKGVQELKQALKKGEGVIPKLEQAVRKSGADMQQDAKRLAPVDTGQLERSITLSGDSLTAEVESTVEYAPYQEYGTRYQSGTPHIRPAFEKQKPIFEKDLQKIVRDATQ